MKILSLFDGMGGGAIALTQLDLPITRYVAYEIDQHAIKLAAHNFCLEIEHRGDVFDADFSEFEGFDYLMGGSPCFCAGTMVYTDKGYKPIEAIQVGDLVLTHKNRFRKVTAFGGKRAMTYSLSATGFMPTQTTANHPYYTRDKIKVYNPETRGMLKGLTAPKFERVDNLKPKVSHLGMNQLQTSIESEIEEKDLWLLGRYVADGHNRISKRKHRKNSYQYQLIISVGNHKLESFKEEITHRKFSCYPHSQSVHRCVFSSEYLCRLVERLGFGTSAKTKTIPVEILNLPTPQLKMFLEGYFSGDGHKTDRGVFCTTVSKTLALSLSMAILKVYGVSANVTTTNPTPTKMLCGREINQSLQYLVSFKYKPSFATAGRLVESQMWTPLKSVTPIGEDVVYNISVEEDESYTANNAIVHNCTHWSIAQSPEKRETTASGIGWELFSQYVRALRESKPKFFIYENNKSMSAEIRRSISETFGFEPILINSALVSAQNRNRLYWVGRRNERGGYDKVEIEQPADRGILLKDILDGAQGAGTNHQGKAHTLTASYEGACLWNTLERSQCSTAATPICTQGEKSQTLKAQYAKNSAQNGVEGGRTHGATMVAEPTIVGLLDNDRIGGISAYPDGSFRPHRGDAKSTGISELGKIHTPEQKSYTLTTTHSPTLVEPEPTCVAQRGRYSDTGNRHSKSAGEIEQHFEARADGKTNTLTCVQKDNAVVEPIGHVQAFLDKAHCLDASYHYGNTLHRSLEKRVRTQVAIPIQITDDGKSRPLQASYGKYATPDSFKQTNPRSGVAEPSKHPKAYEVKNGQITIEIKGEPRTYPIKLADGFYIIRKLTVAECARLQQVPDWYDFSVISNTQAYKCLGNGWSVEVIMHLIRATLK